jgi:hypothetical protein
VRGNTSGSAAPACGLLCFHMGVHLVLWAALAYCFGVLPLTVSAAAAATTGLITAECRPQGLLRLDKPYPHPRRVQLPFCQQVTKYTQLVGQWTLAVYSALQLSASRDIVHTACSLTRSLGAAAATPAMHSHFSVQPGL